ncbi:MAG TPA: hypothetical protein VFZ53_22060 [Polyangiaceae bacterium]
MTRLLLGCVVCSIAAFGCSSDTGEEGHGVEGSGGTSSGTSGNGGSTTGGSAATGTGGIIVGIGGGGTSGSSTGGSAATGNGTAELCDGVDNDANGVIDDVDAGGDGVCDCLNIGTLGHIGPWSSGGNIFATWLNARTPRGAVELADQVLTPELLAPLNVIVSLHVHTEAVSSGSVTAPAHHAFDDSEVAAFSAWVRGGGGVMTTIGYSHDESAEVVNVNRLLTSIGMGYSTTNLDLTSFVDTWLPHPVTDGVRNIFTDNGVEVSGTGMVVAHGEESRAALEVLQVEGGRAVVWGDEWITYDSEWEDVEGQQVELFWLNILKWLSPPRICQVPIPPDVPR